MRRIAALLFAAVLLLAAASAAPTPLVGQAPIHVNSRQRLADMYGREVIFHGANVVVKGPPYIPGRGNWTWNDSFVTHDMEVMRALGLNAIRLGAVWPGAEPERGQYNLSYINGLAGIVYDAANYNIRTLLDMHQDVLADRFCGEGVPAWAAITNVTNFPWPLQPKPFSVANGTNMPDPLSQCGKHSWATYYSTQAVGQAFQNLYSNAYGLQDSWSQFWVQVASFMVELGSAVLGYELINEPWAGDWWHDVLLMAPTVADKKNLQPAYDRISRDIRAVDPHHAIFFEGVTWDWFGVGFDHVPGGAEYKNKSVLSYHFYMPPDFSIDVQFDARAKDMRRLGCGAMLTEFGVHRCNGCGDIVTEAVMDKCDSMFQSWLFWELKPFAGNRTGSGGKSPLFHPNGTINDAQAFNMSRTYAQAIAGTGVSMSFNLTTSDFVLAYVTNAEVTLPVTEIYVSPEYHYPTGFNVTLSPPGAVSWNVSAADPRILHVTHDPKLPVGTEIVVAITRSSK